MEDVYRQGDMTLWEVLESCMHNKGWGIFRLWKRVVTVGVVELKDKDRIVVTRCGSG